MAEYVQQTIEEMTNEVLQLERVGLFDKSEISKIINRRKRYEYKLRRRVKSKADFVAYIKYEMDVLSLIAVRRKQDGYKHKKGEIEGAILKRILSLYYIACRNWPQSQELWLKRINFLQTKMKNKSLVSSTFNRMLKVISNKPELWLMAAKYEFETVYSMESARLVLQKGISFNKRSKVLWHEYFKLELLFVDFVRRREKLKKAKLLGKVDIPKYAEDGSLTKQVKDGQVAITICSHALEEVKDDLEFVIEFLNIAKHFTWAETVQQHLYEVLFEKFPCDPRVWQLEASRFIDALETDSPDFPMKFAKVQRKCDKLMKKMIREIETEESWSIYLEISERLLTMNKTEELEERFNVLLSLADNKGFLSEQWTLKWVKLVAEQEGVVQVLSRLEGGVRRYPQSLALWTAYIEYTHLKMGAKQAVHLFHATRRSLKKESLPLWQMITQLCMSSLDADELTNLYELAVVTDTSVAGKMKEEYMKWVYLRQGIKKVRQLFSRLRQTISVTVDFYKMYIDMEMLEISLDLDRIRKAYRHMLNDFGASSVNAWLEIIDLERRIGDVSKTSVLYSQAIKSLDDKLVQEFIHQHTVNSNAQ